MEEDPQVTVKIGLREVYDAVVRLTAQVERLINSDVSLREDLQRHEVFAKEAYSDHEDRIRSLERSRWPLPSVSILIAIGAFAMAVFQYLSGGG